MSFLWRPPLTEDQLRGLDEHKYSCKGRSIIEPAFQVLWNWLVEQLPLWIAPNLLTITGLALNVVTSLLVAFYCPNATETAPAWVFYLCALGLFTYQCLDAIDGKQARRTGTSSAMGELFDHGCDSVSTFIVILSTVCAMQMGSYPLPTFLYCFTSIFVFYSAHWRAYVTGTLQFGKLDVTEAQLLVIIVYTLSGALGQSIWATRVYGIEMKLIIVFLSLLFAWATAANNLRVILEGGQGKNGSTVADTSVLSPAFPMAFLLFTAYTLYLHSTIFHDYSSVFVFTFGVAGAKASNNLVIAHMSKSPIGLFDRCLIGPLLMLMNLYFHSFIDEFYLMIAALCFGTFDLVFTSAMICRQLCDHMKIYCFTIWPKAAASN
ncbi:choline/ethanolaminephosphotransferase 1-like [Oscarella lobularis]|uniref:choline/ethanolaminephosphotransferase 1-like n=1 Tax=Oscarella lobularis TaxID=121494 RepID=UPI003313FA29